MQEFVRSSASRRAPLAIYVDRWTVVCNLRTAKAGLDAAIAVAESCQWPTSGDWLEV
jgi:hypothetical protein